MEAEDEDVGGCLRFREGGEEVGCEDWGVDGFAAAVERDDVGFEG